MKFLLVAAILCIAGQYTIAKTIHSQIQNDSTDSVESTTIGGYGNITYRRNNDEHTATVDLDRAVLFIGHKFKFASLMTEWEIEDAKVSGGEDGGEIALEQAYLSFELSPRIAILAGLFIPQVGILNNAHLPTEFYGNDRNLVETYIIPSTWREIGIGVNIAFAGSPIRLSAAFVNGLNSANFQHGSGIREGRAEGRNASANNLAFTGAIQYTLPHLRMQFSGYYGGTIPWNQQKADSLSLESGPFGTPVSIIEGDIDYSGSGFHCTLLGSYISIPKAGDINRAYGNNTPSAEYGAYLELGYNLLHTVFLKQEKQLIIFSRCEKLDLNSTIPANGIYDGALNQIHFIAGLQFLPETNIVIKADFHLSHTGDANTALILNPASNESLYQRSNTYFSLGIGYSF